MTEQEGSSTQGGNEPAKNQAPEPSRVRQFLTFFKNYMSLSSLVVAALPIPVTMLGFIPTYAAQTKLLSVYTSLFCFLLLGFVFYSRRSLANHFFPRGDSRPIKGFRAGPLPFILLSVGLLFTYQYLLQQSATKYTRESSERNWQIVYQEYFERTRCKKTRCKRNRGSPRGAEGDNASGPERGRSIPGNEVDARRIEKHTP